MIHRYAVTVDGATRAVELEDGEGKLRVTVDGRARLVDARSLGGGLWSVLDGTSARMLQVDYMAGAHTAGGAGKMTVEVSHPDGEPRIVLAELASVVGGGQKPPPGAAVPGGAAFTVRAPIPGRLVKLLVKPGEVVKAGQTLLVLEAMKMENELRAPRGGTVAEIQVSEGVAVEAGQDLMSIA